jgi:ATP-dependent DNA helicase RecQ
VALTATADANTRHDILTALKMERAEVFLASFHRPNLHLAAEPKVGETAQLLSFLARHKGACGIVYCGSRARTERVAAKLQEKGFPAVPFHAGLDPQQKRESAARFRSGEPLVVVATIAFGMGIDRPDVRFVVHLDMPDSPEAYYQQIGRAGRDGDPAETLLLYDGQDVARARHWLAQSAAPSAQKRVMRMRLEEMVAQTETVGCRTQRLLACFGETMPAPCGHCDNCDDPPLTADATLDARKLLSAVYRTDQIFGAVHTIAVLRHGHDKLSVFGIGADHSVPYWRGIVRQLIALGALDVDTQGHGGLFLVEDKARPILRGEAQVQLRQAPSRKAAAEQPSRGLASAAGEFSQALFDALRSWRAGEAKSQAVPPYVIFHDATLREIAAARPTSLDELGLIKGVGASKLQRYGGRVLRLLGA